MEKKARHQATMIHTMVIYHLKINQKYKIESKFTFFSSTWATGFVVANEEKD
jgi:hypothetical protein